MSEKKKKEASQKKWTKVGLIVLAILFVVVMVVSSMGTGWITGLAPVSPGDKVVIDFTIYDTAGNPLVTTNQPLYEQTAKAGKGIMYAKQLTLTANQSLNTDIFPVPVYTAGSNGGSWNQFALFSPEYAAITQGLVGMRTSEKKNIVFNATMSMSKLYTPADLPVNTTVDSYHVGDVLTMGLSTNPNATVSSSADISYRIGEVTRVSPAGVIVNFGYPRADITIVSITKG
jgi:hypothetical protein